MAVPRALRRLLEVRHLELEQARLALEPAQSELHRLETALETAQMRQKAGRALLDGRSGNSNGHKHDDGDGVRNAGWSGDTAGGSAVDRQTGYVEVQTAGRMAAILTRRIAAARAEVERLRQAYLAKHVEQRQAETLIEESRAAAALHAARREQQVLDDLHGAGLYRDAVEARRAASKMGRGSVAQGEVETPRKT